MSAVKNGGITDPYPLDSSKTTNEQAATYQYNHLGQRISKTVAGTITYFVYSNDDGQLLGEYNNAGQPIRIYVYLEGERVAMLNYNNNVSPPTVEKLFLANNHIGQAQYGWDEWGACYYNPCGLNNLCPCVIGFASISEMSGVETPEKLYRMCKESSK